MAAESPQPKAKKQNISGSSKKIVFSPYGTHNCQFLSQSEILLPVLPSDATYWEKIKRWKTKMIWVNEKNPRCQTFFRSGAAIFKERKRHILQHPKIIHPLSMFRIYWEAYMAFVYFLALLVNPADATFCFYVAPVIVDILCYSDIIISFMTGVTNKYTKDVHLEPFYIFRCYLPWFFIDISSSMPTTIAAMVINYNRRSFENVNWGIRVLDVMKLLKIARLGTFMTYLSRTMEYFELDVLLFRIFRYIIMSILVLHWGACVNYMVPLWWHGSNSVSKSSWIARAGFLNPDVAWFVRYCHSLFRAAAEIFCASYGVYISIEPEDIVTAIVCFVFGYIYWGFMFVLVLQIFMSIVSSQTKYQEIMNQVQEYMRHKNLPISMQKRLICYYEYRFRKSYFRESAISATLSEKLRREVTLYCCRKLVENVSIFNDLPSETLSEVVANLQNEIFLPNDVIVKAGSIGDCMYFLASGTVAVSTTTHKEVCHLQDGAYFGELALLLKDQRRVANVVAIEICEVYRLDRRFFRKCFVRNPEVYQKIEKLAEDRRRKTIMIEEMHKTILIERSMRTAVQERMKRTVE